MTFQSLALPAVFLLVLSALTLLISLDWRISIAALALQYVGVFLLVALSWPLEMAVAKLVAGWITGAVLGMAILEQPQTPLVAGQDPLAADETRLPLPARVGDPVPLHLAGRLFRLLAATLVGLAVLTIAPQITGWVGSIHIEQAWGGLLLIGIGLMQLGFTARRFRTILGLLTVLAGFEIIYAALETSTLVAGLLAAVNLGLALVGSYLIEAPYMEETE